MLSRIVSQRASAILVLVLTALLSGLAIGFAPDQPPAEATDGLPAGAQSTRVVELGSRFPSGQNDSAVIVYERADGVLTEEDRAAATAASNRAAAVAPGITLVAVVPSADGQALLATLQLPGGRSIAETTELVDDLREAVRSGSAGPLPAGLDAKVTGSAAFRRDIAAAFDGADVTLLVTTAAVVALLLLVTYRSPILWIVPLVVIGVGDQVATKALPWLARIIGERTDASVSGIVSVLVFGAGTDYALLLISRYREELRRTPDRRRALAAAVASATPAILASATTVIFALLALLAAVLTSNRTLGIASALGIAIALLFGLVVLPAALACLPRGVFWPFVPRAEPAAVQGDFIERGLWWRIAVTVARRPMAALAGATVILLAMVAMLPGLRVGLSQTEVFRTTVESVTGQEILARRFSSGTSQPLKIIAASQAEERVRQLITETAGLTPTGRAETSTDGRLVAISASLEAEAGTAEADRTINRLRDALPTIEGADAIVGGAPASDLDKREANTRDNWVTAPLILTVVFLVLLVLLRSLVAPVILLATVVGSFAASIGAGSLALRVFFDSPALDSGVPLLAFLFLVALGVDYNIFLATRAREEATALGDSRAGMTRALAATGGVITSAGILLAAVFAVLGVLPVIALTQIGVIVGIGVLLDTLVVRTVVVPAFAHLLGDRFWWPVTPSPVTRSPVTRSPAPPDPSGG